MHTHNLMRARTLIDRVHFLALNLYFTLHQYNLKPKAKSYVTLKYPFDEVQTGKLQRLYTTKSFEILCEST